MIPADIKEEEIDENMKFISQNLLTYLDEILNDRDPESMEADPI